VIKVEQTAKTVDEAIEIVLSQYNVTRDDIKVTVVDEGKKGFLGIGTKEAKIIVEIKEESEKKQERALEFVKSVVEKMGLNAEIDIKEEDGTLFVNIESPDVGVVIGRRGETLIPYSISQDLWLTRIRPSGPESSWMPPDTESAEKSLWLISPRRKPSASSTPRESFRLSR